MHKILISILFFGLVFFVHALNKKSHISYYGMTHAVPGLIGELRKCTVRTPECVANADIAKKILASGNRVEEILKSKFDVILYEGENIHTLGTSIAKGITDCQKGVYPKENCLLLYDSFYINGHALKPNVKFLFDKKSLDSARKNVRHIINNCANKKQCRGFCQPFFDYLKEYKETSLSFLKEIQESKANNILFLGGEGHFSPICVDITLQEKKQIYITCTDLESLGFDCQSL